MSGHDTPHDADLAQPEEQPSPKRQVGGSKPSVRAKYRSTLRGAPGGNGAHCHKARAGRYRQLNRVHPRGAVRDANGRTSDPIPPSAQDHPWGKRPTTTGIGPRGNSKHESPDEPVRPRRNRASPRGAVAVAMRAGPRVGQRSVKPSLRQQGSIPWRATTSQSSSGQETGLSTRQAGFDSPLGYRFKPRSANGQATWFSARQSEFDSPSGYARRIQPIGGGTPLETGLPSRAWGFDSLILRAGPPTKRVVDER